MQDHYQLNDKVFSDLLKKVTLKDLFKSISIFGKTEVNKISLMRFMDDAGAINLKPITKPKRIAKAVYDCLDPKDQLSVLHYIDFLETEAEENGKKLKGEWCELEITVIEKPTSSKVVHIQTVGRAKRIKPKPKRESGFAEGSGAKIPNGIITESGLFIGDKFVETFENKIKSESIIRKVVVVDEALHIKKKFKKKLKRKS